MKITFLFIITQVNTVLFQLRAIISESKHMIKFVDANVPGLYLDLGPSNVQGTTRVYRSVGPYSDVIGQKVIDQLSERKKELGKQLMRMLMRQK